MNASVNADLSLVWQEVRQWPPRQRVALASRILQSLQPEAQPALSHPQRQQALLNLIGIWKTPQPPSDEDVARIVAEERLNKHS